MFVSKIPKLEPGPLKKEILHRLRDIPLDEMNIRYRQYPDGIISGCDLFEENMKIGVQPGIVKYASRLYFLTEKSSVEYRPTDNWTVLKIKFSPQHHHAEYDWYIGQLSLDENVNVLPNEIEVGRFKLKVGSRLRTVYENFEDMSTEYDTVNLSSVKWSTEGSSTMHPEILMHFAREAYPFTEDKIADCSFCTATLANGGIVQREAIEQYIALKNKIVYRQMSNEEVFEGLATILQKLTGKNTVKSQGNDGVYVM